MKNNLAEKIIEKIQKEKIKPTPRWEFVMKDSFFWGTFVLSVLVGGISVSIILNTLLNNDWDLYMRLSDGLTKFIVLTLPYFWIIFLVIFLTVAYLNIQHTKRAYKYNLFVILTGTIIASFLLGITFYNLGLAYSLDKNLVQKLPPQFKKVFDSRAHLWQKPEGGLLAGKVLKIDQNRMTLEDEIGKIWTINLSDDILKIVPKEFLQEGVRIKIIGEEFKCENYCFDALMLRPFDGMRRGIDKIENFNKEIFEEMNLHMRGMMEGRIQKALRN